MKIRKIISTILCIVLMLSLSVTAFADELTLEDPGISNPGISNPGSSFIGYNTDPNPSTTPTNNPVVVEGDVQNIQASKNLTNGITYIGGTPSSVPSGTTNAEFKGNATGNTYAVYADGKDFTVTVDGDATGKDFGAVAINGANVTVGGNANATETSGKGVEASGTGTEVTVGGDATGGAYGVYASNGATVIIGEDVTAKVAGIEVDNGANTVAVEGCVAGNFPILFTGTNYNFEDFSKNKILVGSFNTSEPKVGFMNEFPTAVSDENSKKVLTEQVYYIVSGDASVSGTSEETVGGKTYNVVKEGTELTIAKPADGYELKLADGSYSTLVPQEDGSYKLTVARGGGINLSLILKPVSSGDVVYAVAAISIQFDKDGYQVESGKDLTVKADIKRGEDLVKTSIDAAKIYVDDTEVDSDSFTLKVENGQLVIEFDADYLATLDAGSHIVKLQIGGYTFSFKLDV